MNADLAAAGLPCMLPLRDEWRAVNRRRRRAKALERVQHRIRDKRRPKCRCQAYPWPHRPGGGLCRCPDLPAACWLRTPRLRRYQDRYAGLRRQIARANGLHPIRDRALIRSMSSAYRAAAKGLKRREPRIKYRNVEVVGEVVRASWQTVGPLM